MGKRIDSPKDSLRIPYIIVRITLILFLLLMFLPAVSPTHIVVKAGQGSPSDASSLFTNGINADSLINGLNMAFKKGWIGVSGFSMQYYACLAILISVMVSAVGGCMSVGNGRMRTVGNWFLLAGSTVMLGASAVLVYAYFVIIGSADPDRIIWQQPIGLWIFPSLAACFFLITLWIFIKCPRVPRGVKMEMEGKYQLFLMLMPFLALVFAFSYLPLASWRYAFYDYQSGQVLTAENFVGFKWFLRLVQNEVYVTRLLNVLKNTLIMSGLGIVTSWVPMAFAIFLTEARSAKFKRVVQTFTTIPNFISWVLVYAIAFAIFSTDGFINTLLTNLTGDNYSTNYLNDASYSYLKMLLWGMWKGVGWSAIIYISGIAGIDQQLYEAATVDGAGRFQKMWHITVPGLLPTFVVMLVMSIAGILSNGMDQYLVFTNAINKDYLEVLDLYVYNLGIDDGQIPLSTVVGMTKSIISVMLLFVANTASKWIRGSGVV